MSAQDSAPLTTTQRLRLIAEILPFFVWIGIALFAVTIMDDIINAPVPPLLYGLIVVVLAVVGFTAVQRFRDLIRGSAVVQDDFLKEMRRSRHGRRRTPYGYFEQLGKMRVILPTFYQTAPGARYRVTYSPVSKIVWKLERLPDYPSR